MLGGKCHRCHARLRLGSIYCPRCGVKASWRSRTALLSATLFVLMSLGLAGHLMWKMTSSRARENYPAPTIETALQSSEAIQVKPKSWRDDPIVLKDQDRRDLVGDWYEEFKTEGPN